MLNPAYQTRQQRTFRLGLGAALPGLGLTLISGKLIEARQQLVHHVGMALHYIFAFGPHQMVAPQPIPPIFQSGSKQRQKFTPLGFLQRRDLRRLEHLLDPQVEIGNVDQKPFLEFGHLQPLLLKPGTTLMKLRTA